MAADMVRTRQPGMVTEKRERDLVTEVDVAVEQAVRKHLQEASPEVGILGEEGLAVIRSIDEPR